MTRKDYVLLADALRRGTANKSTGVLSYRDGVEDAALSIADALARDNPRFDRERFLRDAGVTG